MKIHCDECMKYLGEIRDAKLRNGIVYQCAECAKQARQASAYLRMQKASRKGDDMPDFLRGLFR